MSVPLATRFLLEIGQGVPGAPSTFRTPNQNATLHQVGDVTQGSVLGALGHPRPPGRGELAFKTIQKTVDDESLSVIDAEDRVPFPRIGPS